MIIDLHFHTELHGPMGLHDLREYIHRTGLIQRALSRGLDGICLTEHGRLWSREAVQAVSQEESFLIFRGVEVTTSYADFGHMLVYGLDGPMGGTWDVEKLAEMARWEGGALVLAHPFREAFSWGNTSAEPRLSFAEACRMPVLQMVHGVEICNGATRQEANDFAHTVSQALGLRETGGSDAHSAVGVGSCATIFEQPVRTEEELIAEIQAGRFRPTRRRNGPFI